MGTASTKAAQWFILDLRSFVNCGKAWHRSQSPSPSSRREEKQPTLVQSTLAEDAQLTKAQMRWLRARPGREVIITRGNPNGSGESWEVVVVEDDKAIVAVRGECRRDTLEKAFSALGSGFLNGET
jgi:hypothetical protein